MNINGMHINLDVTVDKVNSLKADQLLPEEKDIELNKAIQRFINQRYGKNNIYNEGFEQSQKRIDDLRSLLVEYEDEVFFKEILRPGKVWVDTFAFPSNYMYLVNQRSSIWLDNCRDLGYIESQQSNIAYFVFRFEDLVVNGNEFVSELRMHDGVVPTPTINELVWTPSQELLAAGYTVAGYPQYTQQVIEDITENPEAGFSIHWQSYANLNFPNQFIVVVDTSMHSWYNWDASSGNPLTPLVGYDALNDPVTDTFPRLEDRSNLITRVPDISDPQKDTVLNRFSQQDDIFKLLDDPFNTTSHEEPLTTVREGYIDVYTNAIFIIEKVKITYLRRPQVVSLSLGYDCDLPEHTHEEIVAMAASSILEEITDPRYKTQQGELFNRE